jgi:Cu(I)/Ag(I) efflux system membrane protein CusA/SilA
MERLVAFCARRSWLVLALALVVAGLGEAARRSLSRDVIPDLSEPQIVLLVDWMGHSATDVAEHVTRVLTKDLEGVPGAVAVRGTSMSGMAYIDVVFDSVSSLKSGRAAIAEQLEKARAQLPKTARVQLGPSASSTGWVFEYALVDPHRKQSPQSLRRFQDDVLRPLVAKVPGVAEVASLGGEARSLSVDVRLDQLRERGLSYGETVDAVRRAIDANPAANIEILQNLALSSGVRVKDVAYVRFADDMTPGLADLGGAFDAVGGVVIASRDADPSKVAASVRALLDAHKQDLPPGAQLVVAYDRTDLVTRVESTLIRAVLEEVAVVVLVILVFLMHGRSALVPLVTLPLVLLLTFAAMWLLHVPATLMSLGGVGIAIGIAVDADVVALEACHRRLEGGTGDLREKIRAAAASFTPAILTSLVITALSFLPVFGFTGEAGRLLRPFALTKTLVIASAAIVTLTVAPALRDRLLRRGTRPELDNPLTRNLIRVYRPFVHFALSRPWLTLATALLAVVSCLPIVTKLGGEFLPRIDEGDLLSMPTTAPGVSAEQALSQMRYQDRTIAEAGEVAIVLGKVGRAETATDPAPYSMIETTIRLRPKSDWPKVHRARWYSSWAPGPLRKALALVWPEETASTTAELVERLDKATHLPGWTNAWTAPARARLDMMSTGLKTPVGLRIVAATPERLEELGSAARAILARVEGTRSATLESLGGEPRLAVTIDPDIAKQLGVDVERAREVAATYVDGGQVGDVDAGGVKTRVRVLPAGHDGMRSPTAFLRELSVRPIDPSAPPVALALLARTSFGSPPAMVRAERGELCAYVIVDLDGSADLATYVARADRALVSSELKLASGERTEWAGQYKLLEEGEKRFRWIVPIVAVSMLALLYLLFRSITEALIVLVSVPFALVGSVWALYLLGYPLSAPVWIGLLSVLGLAMQTGVVMVVYIDEAFHRRVRAGTLRSREDIIAAHAEGTVQRLRPKLMTIATMATGLLPMLWSDGAGAEIMRRVAAPMIGGLATSAFLTLEVLPVLYTLWRTHQLKRAEREGVSIDVIVGRPPPWAR